MDNKSANTPMMQQYLKLKSEVPNHMLLYRMGDFYELFFEDAIKAVKLINLTLTKRSNAQGDPVPMAGVPVHTLDQYLVRLINAGESVAICEQTGSAGDTKGPMERKIVRIITPGTITDDSLLNSKQESLLMAIFLGKKNNTIGLAWLSLASGKFMASQCNAEQLEAEIFRIAPAEIIFPETSNFKTEYACAKVPFGDWHFNYDPANRALRQHFGIDSLTSFDLDNAPLAIQACGALLEYALHAQKNELPHIQSIQHEYTDQYLILDPCTRRNLEISSTVSGNKGPTLFSTLDKCQTPMGSRLLLHWLHNPLRNNDIVLLRQQRLLSLMQAQIDGQSLDQIVRPMLHNFPDFERISTRIALRSVRPRELVSLGQALLFMPKLHHVLKLISKPCLEPLLEDLNISPKWADLLNRAMDPDPAAIIRDGGVIAQGFDKELDELRNIAQDSSSFLLDIEKRERERTGINTLKVQYNRLQGFFIEVSIGQSKQVPEDYKRRQTLKNSERFITPELKLLEDKVLSAQERSLSREKAIFEEILQHISALAQELNRCSHALAQIDLFLTIAQHGQNHNWVCPELVNTGSINIQAGRHPVVETQIEVFTPNNCDIDPKQRLMIITGPNMGGKSTYMRQIALIVLLARTGCLVPAKYAQIGLIDRIFTRIGASDDLAGGRSTFMIEMTEAATILAASTSNSLVLMDEIGRGTSTFDGLSLAWAIAIQLLNHNQALTLFATHYFELTALPEKHHGAFNVHLSAAQSGQNIVFLHEVLAGPANKSYGIDVAQRAGLPITVIRRARNELQRLEMQNESKQIDLFQQPENHSNLYSEPEPTYESTSQEAQNPIALKVLDLLNEINPDELSPKQALEALYTLKQSTKH